MELDFFGMSPSCLALGNGVQNAEGEMWSSFLRDSFWERGLGKDLLVAFMALGGFAVQQTTISDPTKKGTLK